jgi:hypothetical protein
MCQIKHWDVYLFEVPLGNGAVLAMKWVCAGTRCVAVTCVGEEIELKKRVLRACEKVKASERYRIQCT